MLLPIDLREWVADEDLAHFIVEACERVDISAFHVSRTGAGKAQYHPRMMLALLIYCYASGIFSSRRIEQATCRHVSARCVAANTHPDHDDSDGDNPQPPAPDKQTNLTDPDSAVMRKSVRHEYRQAYNAQAIVDADGSQLVLATDVYSTTNDRHDLDGLVGGLCDHLGKPETLLADAGYGSEQVVEALKARGIEPLIAISRQQAKRNDDFRPSKEPKKPPPAITATWRMNMQEKLQTKEGKDKYRKRKQTVESVFGIIKSVLGFTRFHLRGIENVKNEWLLMALAYNCKRMTRLATT